jgi:uroporphyrinogen decarboxylase
MSPGSRSAAAVLEFTGAAPAPTEPSVSVSAPPASAFLRACRRLPVPYTPVWAMRQAGRYLPDYRRIRDRMSLLDLCKTPDVAAEVTVQPVDRLGVDAAIVFADILLLVEPLGLGLAYAKGEGPVIERPVRGREDVARLPDVDPADAVPFVFETVRLARRGLAGRVPLIGFAGAPFTVASYLIEGGASRDFLATKRLMYGDPPAWKALMEKLSAMTARYLCGQIDAGADAVQLFDSWAGALSPDAYRRYVLPHTRAVLAALPVDAPVIHFGTGTAGLLEAMRDAGGHVIGLDWRVDLGDAWARLGPDVGVQGNLDPAVLLSTTPEIRRGVALVLEGAAGRPGHIFNLGHGVLPDTPWEHVRAMVDMVHELSRR